MEEQYKLIKGNCSFLEKYTPLEECHIVSDIPKNEVKNREILFCVTYGYILVSLSFDIYILVDEYLHYNFSVYYDIFTFSFSTGFTLQEFQ